MKYDIYINGSIGYPFSASFIQDELAKVGEAPCTVYISSLGGSVVDALQIRQMFLGQRQPGWHHSQNLCVMR